MNTKVAVAIGVAVCVLLPGMCSTACGQEVKIRGSDGGVKVNEEIVSAFAKSRPDGGGKITVEAWASGRDLRAFAPIRCSVLMQAGPLSAKHKASLKTLFPEGSPQPQSYRVGQLAVYIVVNRKNPIRQLTYAQILEIFSGRFVARRWNQLGGADEPINCYGELKHSKSFMMIRNECMLIREKRRQGWTNYKKSMVYCKDDLDVADKVSRDPNGIGFLLYRQRPVKDVKIIAVSKDKGGPFHLPTPQKVYEIKYPLLEALTLYLHPKAPPIAKEYCQFACGPEAAKIIRKWHMSPKPERPQHLPVALGVTTNRAAYVQGEEIWAKVRFTTKSAKGVALTNPEVIDGTQFLYFEVRNDAGSVLEYRGEMISTARKEVNVSVSQPYSRRVDLRWLYDFDSPGTYKFRAMYYNPYGKYRIASPEQTIEIKKADSVRVLSSVKMKFNTTYELVAAKSGKDELYMLRHSHLAGKKRKYGGAVRIKMDKESARRASIVQVVDGEIYRGEMHRGVKIAMGDRVMVVNVQRGGPQVLARTVNRKADDVELKLAPDKKFMLVGKDGQEFHVQEPTSKPAAKPANRPAGSTPLTPATQTRDSVWRKADILVGGKKTIIRIRKFARHTYTGGPCMVKKGRKYYIDEQAKETHPVLKDIWKELSDSKFKIIDEPQ